ncbi:MAG: hypothetical protein KAI40_00210 [Desulfobacterales bacterium]|nr:hypothetical protein [Desulfobacterales bacterium]
MFKLIKSIFNVFILRVQGAKIGKKVRILGKVNVLCRDGASLKNLIIEDNVEVEGVLYLRVRKSGRIIIEKNVKIATEVWLVTANESELRIRKNAIIGSYCILNGGHGIDIGEDSWLAGFVYLNSSDHKIELGEVIRKQGYIGAKIIIGANNWIGGHAFFNKGVITGEGVVVGAGAVVTKSFNTNSVIVGNPAELLRYRT